MNGKLMFSSASDQWNTPKSLVDELATVFNWDTDVCASSGNVCESFHDKQDDGLLKEWRGLCWMNPPYGRVIGHWMNRAKEMGSKKGTAIVCLVPARTDTRWWQNNVKHSSQIVLIKGRLKFGQATNAAPFPSAFVVFGELSKQQREKLGSFGMSVKIDKPPPAATDG